MIHPPTSIFEKGDTVKGTFEGTKKAFIITNRFRVGSGIIRYKVRELNKTKNTVVSADKIEAIRPDP